MQRRSILKVTFYDEYDFFLVDGAGVLVLAKLLKK